MPLQAKYVPPFYEMLCKRSFGSHWEYVERFLMTLPQDALEHVRTAEFGDFQLYYGGYRGPLIDAPCGCLIGSLAAYYARRNNDRAQWSDNPVTYIMRQLGISSESLNESERNAFDEACNVGIWAIPTLDRLVGHNALADALHNAADHILKIKFPQLENDQ